MADEVVAKRGWLKKQSSIVRSWNLKWFVIRGTKMLYYAKDDEAKLQGVFELRSYRISEIPNVGNINRSDQPDRWLFELVPDCKTPSMEALTFMAGSEQERQDWVTSIRRVLYREFGGGVFGQRLEETMQYNTTSRVPQVVQDCIEYLRKHGLGCEGILRLSGRSTLVKEMRKRYDEGKRPDFVQDEIDVHTVASVLKLYFRELPEPVIPYNVFHQYLDIATSFKFQSNNKETFSNLRRLLQKLPKHNYDLLNYLVTFLSEVDENCAENKMPMSNLGLIFGTHILRDENSSPELEMGTQHLTTQIVLALIKWHKDLFGAPDNSLDPLRLPDLISFEDTSSSFPPCTSPQVPKLPVLLSEPVDGTRLDPELDAPSALLDSVAVPATVAVTAAAGVPETVASLTTAANATLPSAELSAVMPSLAAQQMATGCNGDIAVSESVATAPAANSCNGGETVMQSSESLSPVAATGSLGGHDGIVTHLLHDPKVPRQSLPITSAVPKLLPPPVAPKRQRSLPKKLDRPDAIVPTSPGTRPPSAVELSTFRSYIQSPTMTPCLESMPTSVGDLQALVFSLKLLLREKEAELVEARGTIAELRASNENAVTKVVLLQTQLVEYESRFGTL